MPPNGVRESSQGPGLAPQVPGSIIRMRHQRVHCHHRRGQYSALQQQRVHNVITWPPAFEPFPCPGQVLAVPELGSMQREPRCAGALTGALNARESPRKPAKAASAISPPHPARRQRVGPCSLPHLLASQWRKKFQELPASDFRLRIFSRSLTKDLGSSKTTKTPLCPRIPILPPSHPPVACFRCGPPILFLETGVAFSFN